MRDIVDPDPEDLLAHSEFLRRLATSLVGDVHLADDVVQRTFLAAIRTRPRGNLRAWLATVARNFARMEIRATSRRRRREKTVAKRHETGATTDTLVDLDLRTALVKLLHDLAEPAKSALIQRFYHDQATVDIAAQFQVSDRTVRRWIEGGIAQLRSRLDTGHGGRRHWQLLLFPLINIGAPLRRSAAGAVPVLPILWLLTVASVLASLVAVFFAVGTATKIRRDGATSAFTNATHVDDSDRHGTLRSQAQDEGDSGKPTLAVRLTDGKTGSPVPGVQVQLVDGDNAARVTGPSGVATFSVPVTANDVCVRTEGYLTVWRRIQKSSRRVEIALVPGIPIEGQVLLGPERVPAKGTVLAVHDEGSGRLTERGLRVDENGRFVISVRPGVPFRVVARCPGCLPVTHQTTPAEVGGSLDLIVGYGHEIRGSVLDGEGVALANMEVLVYEQRDDNSDDALNDLEPVFYGGDPHPEPLATSTDRYGRFSWRGLSATRYQVVSRDASRTYGARVLIQIAADQLVTTMEITARRRPSLAISIISSDDRGVSGRLSIWARHGGSKNVTFGEADSDEIVVGLPEPGEYFVSVDPAEHLPTHRVVEVQEGTRSRVVMLVRQGLELRGKVVTADDTPVPNIRVSFSAEVLGHGRTTRNGVTARDGTFRLRGLPRGNGDLRVSGGRSYGQRTIRDVRAGADRVIVRLDRASFVKGRLLDKPATAVRILHRDNNGGGSVGLLKVSDDGSFEYRVRGKGILYLHADGRAPLEIADTSHFPAGSVYDLGDLLLARGVEIAGRVRDARGSPIVGATVTAWPEECSLFEETRYTDDDGFYRLRSLAAGNVTVRVAKRGYEEAERTVALVGGSGNVDVTLFAGGRLVVRVFDRTRSRLSEAWVVATPLTRDGEEDATNAVREWLFFEAQGNHDIVLRPGKYRVHAEVDQRVGIGVDIDVVAGEVRDIDLQLDD